MITLHFTDAEKGDDILTRDGMVVDLGGPLFDSAAGDNGFCFIGSMK